MFYNSPNPAHPSIRSRGRSFDRTYLRSLTGLVGLTIVLWFPVACLALEPIDIGTRLSYGFLDGGDLWLATDRDGIFVVDPATNEISHLVEASGIPINKTSCGASAFGKVWLGSSSGLFVSDESHASWERIGVGVLPSLQITALEADGRFLWVGTTQGAARYDSESGEWTIFTKDDGLTDNWVLSIHAGEGIVLFGTMRGGVCEYDTTEQSWRGWTRAEGIASNTVFAVSSSPDNLFAGTTSGFCVMERSTGKWTSYVEGLPSSSVYSLIWNDESREVWLGTGFGIAILDTTSWGLRGVTKVGEVQLERVNDFVESGEVIWTLRNTNLWFNHRTSGVLGFDRESSSWVRPIHLDVLVDQSGYGPGEPKNFMVQSNEPIDGPAEFAIISGAGREVLRGTLARQSDRPDWDAYYWRGDFTQVRSCGNFTITVDIGDHEARSSRFEINNEVLMHRCGKSIYEFLRYMRCGVAHEYRSAPCHLDDGVLPNGTHIDATGGWHCAGLWGGKYSEYHTYVLFNLLFAHDMRPDFFGAIDRDGNGQADIIDEAMWGCEFLLKMQMENGSILHEVVKVEETDGVVGTLDDRAIRGWMPTYNGLLAVAGLAGTAAHAADRYPADSERYVEGAQLSLRFYQSELSGGLGNSINGAAMVLALAQLHRATGDETYLEMTEAYCDKTLSLPLSGFYGTFELCALGHYLAMNPSTAHAERIADYVAAAVDSRIQADVSDSNSQRPFIIPTWRLYIMDPWGAAALLAYQLTGNASYLAYGVGIADCHLGVNPYGICMLEGAGTYDPPGYASYFRAPGNLRAVVPGSIPQGIRFVKGRPHYDISINPTGESAETWLINTNMLQLVSLLPRDEGDYPLEIPEPLALCLLCLTFTAVMLRKSGLADLALS